MAKSHWTKAEPRGCPLIDLVCFYLDDAAQKVIKNKGAPGIESNFLTFCELTGRRSDRNLKTVPTFPLPFDA